MVISATAQSSYDFKVVSTDYRSVIPYDCAILGYDGDKFSKVSGTITIEYSFYEELGNSMHVTVRVGDKSAFNTFKDVNFVVGIDPETNKKIYVVKDNFGDSLLILKPKTIEMSEVFSLDSNKYIFVVYNEILLE
jgi:hypothetical protein